MPLYNRNIILKKKTRSMCTPGKMLKLDSVFTSQDWFEIIFGIQGCNS